MSHVYGFEFTSKKISPNRNFSIYLNLPGVLNNSYNNHCAVNKVPIDEALTSLSLIVPGPFRRKKRVSVGNTRAAKRAR